MAKWKPKADYVPVDHYQVLTDRIVAALEEGKVPWRKPWDSAAATEATEEAAPAATVRAELADAPRSRFSPAPAPSPAAPTPSFSREDFAAALSRRNAVHAAPEPEAASAFRR